MSDFTPAEQEALETVAAMLAERRGDVLDVLRVLFPNPLTRPLYTIEDMMMQARRSQSPSAAFPKSERGPDGRQGEPWEDGQAEPEVRRGPWWLG